ncbi:PAS domain-containing sensor histidine kinase [Lunatibacter salilacus]|uniref:PAS domain-containing sensor histidine kinase n=1 Tax=Lunatibacter salilacus TaxID=2483804 RepID=UPI001F3C39CE|nr:PAS domain-containing sensor histidine kinase [Lunatibacter salilacus]
MKNISIDLPIMSDSAFNMGLFFDLSPDMLCIAGYDGYFRKVNPAFFKLMGYSKEELYSRPISSFVFREDFDKTNKSRENVITGSPLLNFENRYLSKKGEVYWLSWTSILAKEEGHIYAIAKNITAKKRLEDDRNALLASLTKANKELKDLTITTSHDLRAPVNNLLALFEILDLSSLQDPETLELISMLKLSTDGMKATLDAYVDVLGQKELVQTKVDLLDLEHVFNKVKLSLSSLIEYSKADIKTDFSELTSVRFNGPFLESIFLNLLTNSIKYAKTNDYARISITSRHENGINQLIFADEGQGFDMEKVGDKIFGFQQKFHDHADSKGIGLYLIHNHITSLGGKIAVESKLGHGVKFTISFNAFS